MKIVLAKLGVFDYRGAVSETLKQINQRNNVKHAIMVIPNRPWEAPWMIQQFDTVEQAREQAHKYAQNRDKADENDPTRYKVNGFTY